MTRVYVVSVGQDFEGLVSPQSAWTSKVKADRELRRLLRQRYSYSDGVGGRVTGKTWGHGEVTELEVQ